MNGINLIKGLINKEDLQDSININSDSYGSAVLSVAISVMRYLDGFEDEFNIGYKPDMTTPHGIICECDDQGGITGFMAGMARNLVAKHHVLGWKFYLASVLNEYEIKRDDFIEEGIKNVVDAKLVTYDEAKEYTIELVKRFYTRTK